VTGNATVRNYLVGRIGEAANPGPGHTFEVVNPTHLLNNFLPLQRRKFNDMFITEHSLTPDQVKSVERLLASNEKLHCSGLDPELTHQTGGVARITRAEKLRVAKAKTTDMKRLIDSGRVGMYTMHCAADTYALVILCYGKTNGDNCGVARAWTCDAVTIILDEVDAQPDAPVYLVGDFNASRHKINSLEQAVQAKKLIDIGAQASKYGGIDNLGTCKPNDNTTCQRRDYVFANNWGEKLIQSFAVQWDDDIRTHAILTVTLKNEVESSEYDSVRMPIPIKDVFLKMCADKYGQLNIDKYNTKKEEAQKKDSKVYHSEVADLELEDPDKKSNSNGSNAELLEFFVNEHQANVLHDDLERVERDAMEDFTVEQITEQKAILHSIIDHNLAIKQKVICKCLKEGDNDAFMRSLAWAVEDAVQKYAKLEKHEYKSFAGRSTVNVYKRKIVYKNTCNDTDDSPQHLISRQALRVLKQQRRLVDVAKCIGRIKVLGQGDANQQARTNSSIQIAANIRALNADNDARDGIQDVLSDLNSRMDYFMINPFAIIAASKKMEKVHKGLLNRGKTEANYTANKAYKTRRVHALISRKLKAGQTAPMVYLRRPKGMGEKCQEGSIAHQPHELDEVLRFVGKTIFDGNHKDLKKDAKHFMKNYGDKAHESVPFQVGDIHWKELAETCRNGQDSAPGLDGWHASDLKFLSDQCFIYLAIMYNNIEGGASWPKDMLITRGVFLSKDPNKTEDPNMYRCLKITSIFFRKWGSNRMGCLKQWIAQWDHDAINAGVPGKSAQDAWYRLAIKIEEALANGEDIAGASVDVYKCFDQINREVVREVATQAGMPPRILEPYLRFLDDLVIRFQTGKDIGQPHKHRCSIPQGCPFSMMIVALIFIPWINHVKAPGVEPRVLADDLLILTTGDMCRANVIKALKDSKAFFQSIGARVADNKCFTFAYDPTVRQFLTNYIWDRNGLTIPCLSSFRDLGAHLTCNGAQTASTVTKRFRNAAAMAGRLAYMAIPKVLKTKIVLCNILPAAAYGAETGKANDKTRQLLRTNIADAIGPRGHNRSVNIVFDTCTANKDLDPDVYMLCNKVCLLRRMMAKHPAVDKSVRNLLRIQAEKPAGQVMYDNRTFSLWQTVPEEADEDDDIKYTGPVSLLAKDLQDMGWHLYDDLTIHKEGEAPIDLLNMPWQHLKKAIGDLGSRARLAETCQQRTFFGDMDEMDLNLMKDAMTSMGTKEQSVINYINTGAYQDDYKKATYDLSDGKCQHCGEAIRDSTHILGACPEVEKQRTTVHLTPDEYRFLPKALKVGLVPCMGNKLYGPYWTHDCSVQHTKDVFYEPLKAEAKQSLLKYLASTQGVDIEGRNARQIFQLLKDKKQATSQALPNKCLVKAPVDINVYTDGSWINNLKQFLGLGGAGIWWPNRDAIACGKQGLYKRTVSDAESEIAYCVQKDEGTMLYTAIGGFAGSSTRAELAAGIVAVMADGPIHIGSDSKIFVDEANRLLRLLKKGTMHAHRAPWSTVNDGDLWQHFFKAIKAKGPEAIKVSWVKGHATNEHIRSGISTLEQQAGNDSADKAADVGTAVHGKDLVDITGWYHDRYKAYTNFVKRVYKHIVDGYLIHRNLTYLRSKRDNLIGKKKPSSYNALSYPAKEQVNKADIRVKTSHISRYLMAKPWAKGLYQFYDNMELSNAQDAVVRHTTWVELYVLAVHRGCYLTPLKPRPTAKGTSAAKAIAKFKADSRDILKRMLIGSNDEHAFKPAKHTRGILQGLAITGQCPAVSRAVFMDEQEQLVVQKAIVHLSRKVLKVTVDKFVQGRYSLMPIILKYNGKHDWAPSIPISDHPIAECDVTLLNSPAIQSSFLKCPNENCCKVMHSTHKGFDKANIDITLKCMHCKHNFPNGRWKCNCACPWLTCETHAATVSTKQPSGTKRKGRDVKGKSDVKGQSVPKAGQSPKMHRQLVAQDLITACSRRSKRPATNALVEETVQTADLVKRIKFGPTIAARFCRSSGSSSRIG